MHRVAPDFCPTSRVGDRRARFDDGGTPAQMHHVLAVDHHEVMERRASPGGWD
jgi:hypothetical protein